MRIGILGNAGSWYVSDLQRAATSRGHTASRVDFTALTGHIGGSQSVREFNPEAEPTLAEQKFDEHTDVLVVRTMPPGSLEQVVFRMDALAMAAARGTIVFNSPRAVECAVDKYLTTAKLAQAGLAVPRTIVCEDSAAACRAFTELGGDVVVKPLFGAEGRGIVRVSDPEIAIRTFRTLERIDSVLYVQEFLPHDFDTRVLVLGGNIIGAMRRTSHNDFRTNVSQSGVASAVDITESQRQLALAAAEETQADFAGVDLIQRPDDTDCVIEVNAVPGWRAFSRITKTDVSVRVIEYLEHRVG